MERSKNWSDFGFSCDHAAPYLMEQTLLSSPKHSMRVPPGCGYVRRRICTQVRYRTYTQTCTVPVSVTSDNHNVMFFFPLSLIGCLGQQPAGPVDH